MQEYGIKITDLAEEDLEKAGDYIAFQLKNPSAAENTLKGIRKKIDKLHFFPNKCELDEDPILASLGVRRTYYKEYVVYFVIDEENEHVNIVRILHSRMEKRMWLYAAFGINLD